MGRKEKAISSEKVLFIGAKFRKARQHQGISLTEMADKLHYTKCYLSGIENGSIRISKALRQGYVEILGLNPDELRSEL